MHSQGGALPGMGTGRDREKQTLPESANEERDASAFLSLLICSKCYWWHSCEPMSLQHGHEVRAVPQSRYSPVLVPMGSLEEDQQFICALKTPMKSSEQAAFGYICCHVAFGKCSFCACRAVVLLTAHRHRVLHTKHMDSSSCPCWGAQTHCWEQHCFNLLLNDTPTP